MKLLNYLFPNKIIIFVALWSVLSFGLLAYIHKTDPELTFISKYFSNEDSRNTPLSQLSEISWQDGPYTIFYRTPEGLHSISTDGSNKKLLYPKAINHLLLDTSRQILVKERTSLSLLDENGANPQLIFTAPESKWIGEWAISPDESMLAIEVNDENWKDSQGNRNLEQLYIINLKTKTNQFIDISKDLNSSNFLIRINWSKDSKKLYLQTLRYFTPDDGTNYYFEVDPYTKKITRFAETKHYPEHQRNVPLEEVVMGSKPVITRRSSITETYYYDRTSPDGNKKIDIDYQGNIRINTDIVAFWSYNDGKAPSWCRYPGWLPDNNHLVMECLDLRILEVNSRKFAVLDKDGTAAQWFNQRFDHHYTAP